MPIQINNLRANGADLFDDSESYMRELSDGDFELSGVNGGTSPICSAVATVGIATVAASIAIVSAASVATAIASAVYVATPHLQKKPL
jgi:amino acid permease